ncbi:MAG: c-type cytochrome [Alphaproteobacteria bacterium]|nr:c-type cytochrome [Alphaproteobacteria bacterium]
MSDLRFNAIAGAALASVLGVMGLQTAADALYAGHIPETPGFAPEVVETVAAPTGPADAGPPDFGTLFADAAALTDFVGRGERVAAQCTSCHTFEEGGRDGTGPHLWGVFGRAPGAVAGFAYSESMVAHASVGPWSYETLDTFLKSPGQAVRGTKMAFAGLRRDEDRIAMIAYLRSLSASPAPLPAPTAAPAEAAAPEGEAAPT